MNPMRVAQRDNDYFDNNVFNLQNPVHVDTYLSNVLNVYNDTKSLSNYFVTELNVTRDVQNMNYTCSSVHY